MDTSSQRVAAAFHECSSGTGSDRAPSGTSSSSEAGVSQVPMETTAIGEAAVSGRRLEAQLTYAAVLRRREADLLGRSAGEEAVIGTDAISGWAPRRRAGHP